jgi:hypothetical protein
MRTFVAAAILLVSITAQGQLWDLFTNPRVTVTLKHPPGLGLNVRKLAFAPNPNASECGEQFIDALVTDFSGSGAEVIERENLEALLSEHRFNLSEYVDKNAKARLGKMLGPAALIFVKVTRCAPKKDALYDDYKDRKGNVQRTYISRTTVDFKASVRTVDLTTGRTFNAIAIDEVLSNDNRSTDGRPEYPSHFDLQDTIINRGVLKVHRMFFPWTEERELYFFDDEPCGLRTAFRLLKGGDQDGALRQSLENVASCEPGKNVKEKVVWHAQYNVGMAYMILGDFDNALKYLTMAVTAGGGDIVTQTVADCRRAKTLAEELRRVDERPALDVATAAEPAPERKSKATPARAKPPAAADSASDETIEQRLTKLNGLYKKGLITQEEYSAKKSELLGKL